MDDGLVDLNDIYPCIQGEGCLAGVAMVMVRLHGCPVGCPWCDTKETWHRDPASCRPGISDVLGQNPLWTRASPADIASFAYCRFPGPRWALISGGEPSGQPLAPLVDALKSRGYKVALETSGTADGHLGCGIDWVCVSPKVGMPGGRILSADAVASADEIKFVVGKEEDLAELDMFTIAYRVKPEVQICLQPLSQSEKATRLCVEAAIRLGLRVSVQIHKYIGEK